MVGKGGEGVIVDSPEQIVTTKLDFELSGTITIIVLQNSIIIIITSHQWGEPLSEKWAVNDRKQSPCPAATCFTDVHC